MKKRYLSILQEIKEVLAKTERDDPILLVDGLNNFIRCFAYALQLQMMMVFT